MRVSCTFVSLAVMFVAQYNCAPIEPMSAVNQLGGNMEGVLTSAPMGLVSQSPVSALANQLQVPGLPSRNAAAGLASQNSITGSASQSFAGATKLGPATSSLNSVESFDAASATNFLAHPDSVPAFGGMPVVGSLSAVSKVVPFPATGSAPTVDPLNLINAAPFARSAPQLISSPLSGAASGLTTFAKRDPGFGPLSNFAGGPLAGGPGLSSFGGGPLADGPGFPTSGFMPSPAQVPSPLSGISGLGTPAELISSFIGQVKGPASAFPGFP